MYKDNSLIYERNFNEMPYVIGLDGERAEYNICFIINTVYIF